MAVSPKTLGERIRELRRSQNLSMRELAAKANLRSPAFIADVERGFRHPSSEVLNSLANGLGVDPHELRAHDRRAPVQELRALAEKDPAWASALRKLVDEASIGRVTPSTLSRFLKGGGNSGKGPEEPLLF